MSPLLKRVFVLLVFVAVEAAALVLISRNSYFQQNRLMHAVRSVQYKAWERRASWRHYLSLREENQNLHLENLRLQQELSRYHSRESLWLAQNASLPAGDSLHFIPAEVVFNSVNRQENYLILNKGALDGVAPSMGVICERGIVGIVSQVTPHTAQVISLLNTSQQYSAVHQPSGNFGTLKWDGRYFRTVTLSEIPQHIDVAVGDTVVSSPYSALFPPRIPLGVVVKKHAQTGVFLDLDVELFTNFNTLRHVSVIAHPLAEEIKSYEQP